MTSLRSIGPAAALALLVIPMPAPGQTRPDARAAEIVVRQAFDALRDMQGDSVAALVHPDALRRFHLAQLEQQRMRERLVRRPPEERYSPEMPAAVRAWFEEQQRKHEAQHPSLVTAQFAGVFSLEELEALPPREAFARWLEANDARSQMRAHQQAVGQPIPPDTSLREMHPQNEIVGSVVQDDSTIHVLYGTRFQARDADDDLDQLAIATVRRAAEGWRIWMTRQDPQLFGMGMSFFVELPEERAERLREAAERTFTWPQGEAPRVRASVQGYTADAGAPESIRLEVIRPDGTTGWIELPHEALIPLWEYLQNWLYPPGS